MPSTSFSKDITAIFNHSALTESLKYDLVCRLVCQELEVCSVSALMYDAKTDMLVCKGSYLAPQLQSKYTTLEKPHFAVIIENIDIFEYFYSELHDFEKVTVEKFNKSTIKGEASGNVNCNQTRFDMLKEFWVKENGSQLYADYKQALYSERHTISPESITGSFFKRLLENGKTFTNEIAKCLITDGPKNGRLFFDSWECLGIKIPKEELYYIGLPLFAAERYSGVLRITTFRHPKSTIDDIFSPLSSSQAKLQNERLINFAQLISLHLKTNFYLDTYRILSNLKLNAPLHETELNQVCDTLAYVIKCNGCILRLSTEDNNEINPPIRGTSFSLTDYASLVKSKGLTFSSEFLKLLQKDSYSKQDIKAITFAVCSNSQSKTFETGEYYYDKGDRDENKRLKYMTNLRTFDQFTPEYVLNLKSLKICEAVVLRLEFIENGYLVLTNTSNRWFTMPDIELILLASKRIGLEIKHLQDTAKIKEQTKIIEQEENARLIVHQIGAPVRALSGHAQNLDEGVIKAADVPLKISQLNKMSFALLRQVMSLQKYLEWETKPINIKRPDKPFSLEAYFRSRAIQFEGLTVGTRLRIWTIIENPDTFYDDGYFDRSLLDEVVNCLLDNAVKYSFSQFEMLKNGVPFRGEDPYSEGHIHIKLFSDSKNFVLTVQNYGSIIRPDEYDRIFERGIRGQYGKKRAPTGSGIGLYLAKKVVNSLSGKIEVQHEKITHKTTFKVTISHE